MDKENIIDNINDDSSKTNDINFEDEYGQAKDLKIIPARMEKINSGGRRGAILPEPIILAFAGDINFDENSNP